MSDGRLPQQVIIEHSCSDEGLMLKSSATKLFTVASLESYHHFFETPSLHYYLDILGVKPPANDPKKIPVFSLDCSFARRHLNAVSAAGESTRQILFNLSVNCSVHMVKADTALIKSSSSRSATASKTLRTFRRREEEQVQQSLC